MKIKALSRRAYYSMMAGVFGAMSFLCTGGATAGSSSPYDNSAIGIGSKDVGSFASSLADIIITAVLAIAFCVGACMVVMGLVGFAQKRDNPEAAQGAPRKLMAGGALLAVSVIIGVLRATLRNAA